MKNYKIILVVLFLMVFQIGFYEVMNISFLNQISILEADENFVTQRERSRIEKKMVTILREKDELAVVIHKLKQRMKRIEGLRDQSSKIEDLTLQKKVLIRQITNVRKEKISLNRRIERLEERLINIEESQQERVSIQEYEYIKEENLSLKEKVLDLEKFNETPLKMVETFSQDNSDFENGVDSLKKDVERNRLNLQYAEEEIAKSEKSVERYKKLVLESKNTYREEIERIKNRYEESIHSLKSKLQKVNEKSKEWRGQEWKSKNLSIEKDLLDQELRVSKFTNKGLRKSVNDLEKKLVEEKKFINEKFLVEVAQLRFKVQFLEKNLHDVGLEHLTDLEESKRPLLSKIKNLREDLKSRGENLQKLYQDKSQLKKKVSVLMKRSIEGKKRDPNKSLKRKVKNYERDIKTLKNRIKELSVYSSESDNLRNKLLEKEQDLSTKTEEMMILDQKTKKDIKDLKKLMNESNHILDRKDVEIGNLKRINSIGDDGLMMRINKLKKEILAKDKTISDTNVQNDLSIKLFEEKFIDSISKITILQSEKNKLKTRINSLMSQLKEKQTVDIQIKDYKSEVLALKDTVGELSKSKEKLVKEFKVREFKKDNLLKSKLKDMLELRVNNDDQVKDFEDQIVRLGNLMTIRDLEIERVRKENIDITKGSSEKLSHLKEKILEKEKGFKDLKTHNQLVISSLEGEVVLANKRINNLEEKQKDLEKDSVFLKGQLNKIKKIKVNQEVDLENKISVLQSRIKRAKKELGEQSKNYRQKVEDLKEELQEVKESNFDRVERFDAKILDKDEFVKNQDDQINNLKSKNDKDMRELKELFVNATEMLEEKMTEVKDIKQENLNNVSDFKKKILQYENIISIRDKKIEKFKSQKILEKTLKNKINVSITKANLFKLNMEKMKVMLKDKTEELIKVKTKYSDNEKKTNNMILNFKEIVEVRNSEIHNLKLDNVRNVDLLEESLLEAKNQLLEKSTQYEVFKKSNKFNIEVLEEKVSSVEEKLKLVNKKYEEMKGHYNSKVNNLETDFSNMQKKLLKKQDFIEEVYRSKRVEISSLKDRYSEEVDEIIRDHNDEKKVLEKEFTGKIKDLNTVNKSLKMKLKESSLEFNKKINDKESFLKKSVKGKNMLQEQLNQSKDKIVLLNVKLREKNESYMELISLQKVQFEKELDRIHLGYKEKIVDLGDHRNQLKVKVDERDDVIEELKGKVKEEIGKLTKKNNSFKTTIDGRDVIIRGLKKRVLEEKARVSKLTKNTNSFKGIMDGNDKTIKKLEEHLKEKEEGLSVVLNQKKELDLRVESLRDAAKKDKVAFQNALSKLNKGILKKKEDNKTIKKLEERLKEKEEDLSTVLRQKKELDLRVESLRGAAKEDKVAFQNRFSQLNKDIVKKKEDYKVLEVKLMNKVKSLRLKYNIDTAKLINDSNDVDRTSKGKLNELQLRIDTQDNHFNSLLKEKIGFENKLSESRLSNKHLDEEVYALKTKVSNLMESIPALIGKAELALERKIKELNNEIESLVRKNDLSEKTLQKNYRERLKKLNSQVTSFKEKLKESKGEVEKLFDEIEKTNRVVIQKNNQISVMDKKVKSNLREIEVVSSDAKDSLKKKDYEYKILSVGFQTEIISLVKEKKEMNGQISKLTKNIKILRKDIVLKNSDKSALMKNIKEQEKVIKEIKLRKSLEVNTLKKAFEEQIDVLTEKVGFLVVDLQNKTEFMKEMRIKNHTFQNLISELTEEKDDLETNNVSLKKDVIKVKSSIPRLIEDAKKNWMSKIDSLGLQLKMTKKEMRNQKERIIKLIDRRDDQEKAIKNLLYKKDKFENELLKIQKNEKFLSKKASDLEESLSKNIKQGDQCEDDFNLSKVKGESLNDGLIEVRGKYNDLEKNLKKDFDRVEKSLKYKISNLENEIIELTNLNQDNVDVIDQISSDKSSCGKEVLLHKKEKSVLDQEYILLSKEFKHFKNGEVLRMNKIKKPFEKSMEFLEKRLLQVEQKVQGKEKLVVQLQDEIKRKNKEFNDIVKTKERLEKKVRKLQK